MSDDQEKTAETGQSDPDNVVGLTVAAEPDPDRATDYGPSSPLDDLISSLLMGLSHKPTAAPIRKLFGYQNERDARAAIRYALRRIQTAGYRVVQERHDAYHGGPVETVTILDRFTKL